MPKIADNIAKSTRYESRLNKEYEMPINQQKSSLTFYNSVNDFSNQKSVYNQPAKKSGGWVG